MLSVIPGFLFGAVIGWVVIAGAAQTSQALYDADHDADAESRLRRLRQVALAYRGYPISILVLQSTANHDHVA
jgi:hypothetical protein